MLRRATSIYLLPLPHVFIAQVPVIKLSIRRSRLLLFLLVSTGLHALALWAWQPTKLDKISASQPASLLQIALNPASVNMPDATKPAQRQQPASPVKKTTRQQRPVRNTVAQKTTHAVIKTDSQAVTVSTQPETEIKVAKLAEHRSFTGHQAAVKVQDKQLLSEKIQKQLNLKIAFARRYPRIAIRNAWEGQVNLGIRVLSDGQLTDIHIINSSGYQVLDNAALNSITLVANLPEARPWLAGQSIDVVLPVIYKLTDS